MQIMPGWSWFVLLVSGFLGIEGTWTEADMLYMYVCVKNTIMIQKASNRAIFFGGLQKESCQLSNEYLDCINGAILQL